MDKGVNLYMIMGKLRSIEKTLDDLNGKVDDLLGEVAQVKQSTKKGLERTT